MSFWKDLIPDMDGDGKVDIVDAMIFDDLMSDDEEDCDTDYDEDEDFDDEDY